MLYSPLTLSCASHCKKGCGQSQSRAQRKGGRCVDGVIIKSSFRRSNPVNSLSCVHCHLPSHIRISISNKLQRLNRINAPHSHSKCERERELEGERERGRNRGREKKQHCQIQGEKIYTASFINISPFKSNLAATPIVCD